MLSLLISALVAIALASTSNALQYRTGTTVFFSIAGFVGTFFLIGFLVRNRMSQAQVALQESMEAGQRRFSLSHRLVSFYSGAAGWLAPTVVEEGARDLLATQRNPELGAIGGPWRWED